MTTPPAPQRRSPTGICRDVLAGVTLASVNIPQVLGYTRIAAMPAVTGLYTVLLPPLAFAFLGSSKHLVVAADSATAAILSSGLAPLAVPGSPDYIAMVSVVAILCAAFLLIGRLFRLGFLADFLSRTVLAGFVAGVGVQVSISMLPEMLGISTAYHNQIMILYDIVRNVSNIHHLTFAITFATLALLFLGRRFLPRVPAPLLAVIASVIASKTLYLSTQGVATIGPVASGLPDFHIPVIGWNRTLALLPVAASCVFVIIAQSIATSRSFAGVFHEKIDANADILGLSAANLVAAISGTFTVNGSPTQTAMAVRAGARTQLAQITFAAVALCVLLFLTGPLEYLPRCVLAAIVFLVAIDMIDVRTIRAIRPESPGEFRLALVTAAAVVGIGVQQGIFLAIALSLFRHVRHSYEPHTTILHQEADEHGFEAEPVAPGEETEPGLIIYRFSADLFYANCTRFADDIHTLIDHAPTPVRCIVVDASAMTDIDYSASAALRDLLHSLQDRGISIWFGRVSPYLFADMTRHRITTVLPPQNIYPTLHRALASARAVLAATTRQPSSPPPLPFVHPIA
ncbi:SulP family inorganic anion transporter [Acetobacter fallax]|uniref:STAS domain-containing protein n=1 Tax=Acetobacter fallax TaxID=1737473 RepID=A0ABX0K6T0_9PROT|nr:SulP family inorganic anion transporter [Acetobacter fallax]NHO30966.1 STAS domain-containing protein [Acetobacter fallax]NHO34523.1 STAS domain-containing protein [Acetobacter fallax]